MSECAVCGVAAGLKCGGCRSVFYCGKDHQKLHWKNGHRKHCKCYEVKLNAELGRHVIATRDIKAGEIIMREKPLVLGPKIMTAPICLGCNKMLEPNIIEGNFYKCSRCRWPLCGLACEKSPLHIPECDIMFKRNYHCQIDYVDAQKVESAYCVIVPLRCLLLKRNDKKSFDTFMDLEDHLNERINTPLYNVLRSNLVTFVRVVLEMDEFDEMTILKVAAILDTNSFEIRLMDTKSRIRATFCQAAMFSHDCLPNTRHVFDENKQIIFMATVDIPKGSIISTSYTQPLKSTPERREHLRQSKCFDCVCARCSDPTEFNTYFGAILCSSCKNDMIIAKDPLESSAPWMCKTCGHTITAKAVMLGNKSVQKEIETIPRDSPRKFEEFLMKYNGVLHACNTNVIQIKYALTQLYGNVPGFYMHELNDAGLERKISLCNELLELADKFAPGWSDLRGLLLLDLHEAIAIKAKREYSKELLTKDGVQERLSESMVILEEAVKILKVDPSMSGNLEKRLTAFSEEINE